MDNEVVIDNEINDSNEKTSVELHKIGGHPIVNSKPLFSCDGKQIVLSSDTSVRVYSLETGSFVAHHHLGHQHQIINTQTNLENTDEIIVSSKDGFVVFWHLSENRKSNEIQLKLSANETLVTNHYVNNYFYFVVVTPKGTQLFYCSKNFPQNRMPMYIRDGLLNPIPNCLAFGPLNDVKYLAQVHPDFLYIFKIPVKNNVEFKRHMIADVQQFSCVAFHPNDDIIATGDTRGRIILWFNDFMENTRPTRSIQHWHQLSVADICFSPEGSYLYSVGEEMVLVRWNVSGNLNGQNNFLPRLGMPIKYVACDPQHKYLLTSHTDNHILIIGSAMTGIYSSIDELTLGMGRNGTLSSGLSWNSKLKAIVLNGRTGNLQFYSPESQKQLFQLDIVEQNMVSREVDQILFYTEVSKVAVSENGVWLSTVEIRDDKETLTEIRLKFWMLTDNSFSLNTTIHLPHKCEINCIQFSPNSMRLISTSLDKCFKIWILFEENEKQLWKCSVTGNLNNSAIPAITDWSCDSSTIAVAFDSTIALWDASVDGSVKLISILPDQNDEYDDIDYIKFGGTDKSNYLVVCRHNHLEKSCIRLWNVIDMTVIWTYIRPFRLDSFAFNRCHNILALCFDSSVCFLQLEDQKIISSLYIEDKNENDKQKIICSLFVEDNCKDDCKHIDFSSHSNLLHLKFYCLNEKQELFSVRMVNKTTMKVLTTKVIMSECDQNLSPLALMFINKRERKEKLQLNDINNYLQPNINTSKLVEDMFFNVPSHVLPPMHILGEAFLSALLKCQSNAAQKNNKVKSETEPKSPITYPNSKSDDFNNDDKISMDEESEINVKEEVSDAVVEDYSWLNRLSTQWNDL